MARILKRFTACWGVLFALILASGPRAWSVHLMRQGAGVERPKFETLDDRLARLAEQSPILWRSTGSMHTPRAWSPAVLERGEIYVARGVFSPTSRWFYNAVPALVVYDPERDTRQILAPMHMARVGPAALTFCGKYIFGGFTWSSNPFVEIYNTVTNTWFWGRWNANSSILGANSSVGYIFLGAEDGDRLDIEAAKIPGGGL
ncbi:MAG: hypothetical protein QXQ53_01730 [Candidatus Methanosuratincola sp.]